MQREEKKFPTRKHIFDNCEKIFEALLTTFHDKYVERLVMTGVSECDSKLDEVKMTKLKKLDILFYKRIMYGILNSDSIINIYCKDKEDISAVCKIYYIDSGEVFSNLYESFGVNGFYMFQKVHNWFGSSKCSFQIWKLDLDIEDISKANSHWL